MLLISLFLVLVPVHILSLLVLFLLNVFEMVFLVLLPPQLHFLFLVRFPRLVDPKNNKLINVITLQIIKSKVISIMYSDWWFKRVTGQTIGLLSMHIMLN